MIRPDATTRQALHANITRLMVPVYAKDNSSLSRRTARDYFLSALCDPELEINVRERETPDMQVEYKMAIRLETLKKASSAWEVEASVALRESSNPCKVTRTKQDLAEQLSMECLKEGLQKQMNDLKIKKQRRMDELEAENQRLRLSNLTNLNDSAVVAVDKTKPADGEKREYSSIVCFYSRTKRPYVNCLYEENCAENVPELDEAKVKPPPEERATCVERKIIYLGTVL